MITSINPAHQSTINECYKISRQFYLAVTEAVESYAQAIALKYALETLREALPKRELDNFDAQYSKIHGCRPFSGDY